MRIAAIAVMVFNVSVVQAVDVDTARMMGTWSVSELKPNARTDQGAARVAGPMVISERQITWASSDHRQCVAEYSVASRAVAPIFPGGPTENSNATTRIRFSN
jgi:hypothetical protein